MNGKELRLSESDVSASWKGNLVPVSYKKAQKRQVCLFTARKNYAFVVIPENKKIFLIDNASECAHSITLGIKVIVEDISVFHQPATCWRHPLEGSSGILPYLSSATHQD